MFRYVIASLVLAGLSVQAQDATYGVDCSFPIHSKEFRCGNLLGDRKKVYDEYMEGCREFYGSKGKRCSPNEEDRLEMSLRQPQSMVVSDTLMFDGIGLHCAFALLTLTVLYSTNTYRTELHEDWVYENPCPEGSPGPTHCSLGAQQG
jgi:hypothetical protein